MYKTDFAAIKRTTTIQAIVEWLGLRRRRENRYDCPHASNGERAITINPEWKNKDGTFGRYTCWACDTSGDLIALAAHYHKTTDIKAAEEIQKTFTGYEPAKKGLTASAASKIEDEMQYEHPEVQAIGFTPERARELKIGWRATGTKPRMVLIPFRDAKGELIDYIGYSKEKGLSFSKHLLK